MREKHLLTWLRPYKGLPQHPEATPFGRAAITLAHEGIRLFLAATSTSWTTVRAGQWIQTEPCPVDAIYDRYASRSLPEHYAGLVQQSPNTPRGNPTNIIRLCSDKVETQRALPSLPFPAIESDPNDFSPQLSAWGKAFLKPRFGGLGRGIHVVVPGDPLPPWGPGAVRGGSEPTFLQKAIEPPEGFGSLCVRWLIQREPTGEWIALPPVARVSEQLVANVHQGANAFPAEDVLPKSALRKAQSIALDAAKSLQSMSSGPIVELGIDLVFDRHFDPWILEINSRPSGRFRSLSEIDPHRFQPLADQAVMRPLRCLAALT